MRARKISTLRVYSISDNTVDPESATTAAMSGAAPVSLGESKKTRTKKIAYLQNAGSSTTSVNTDNSNGSTSDPANNSSSDSSSDDEDLLDTLKKRGHDTILEKLEAVHLGECNCKLRHNIVGIY